MLHRFQVETALPEGEAISRIAALIRNPPPPPPFWTLRRQQETKEVFFRGSVEGNAFRLRRIIRQDRILLNLVMTGRVIPSPMGSSVVVTMSPTPLATAIFLFYTVLLGAAMVWQAVTGTPVNGPVGFWWPLELLALLFLLGLSQFIDETRTARRQIEEVVLR